MGVLPEGSVRSALPGTGECWCGCRTRGCSAASLCPQGYCRTSGWTWTSTAWAWEITIVWLEKALALVPKFPKSLPWIAVLTLIRSVGVSLGTLLNCSHSWLPVCSWAFCRGAGGVRAGWLIHEIDLLFLTHWYKVLGTSCSPSGCQWLTWSLLFSAYFLLVLDCPVTLPFCSCHGFSLLLACWLVVVPRFVCPIRMAL